MEQQKVFPTACFGFDKKVVLDYIYEQDTAAKAKEAEMEERSAHLEAQVAELQGTIEELNAQCELMRAQLYSEKETSAGIRASYEKLKSDADQLVQVARNKDKELQIQLELNKQLQHRNSDLESRLATALEEQEPEDGPTPEELMEETKARAAAILEKARKEAEGIREAAAAREADQTAEVARLKDELARVRESVGKTLSQLEGEIQKLHGEKEAQEQGPFFPRESGQQQEAGRVKVKKIRR